MLLNESQAEVTELKEELEKIKKRILQWVKISGKYTAEYNKTVFYRNNCGKRELTLNYIIKHVLIYFYNVYGDHEIAKGRYATLIGIFRAKMEAKASLRKSG